MEEERTHPLGFSLETSSGVEVGSTVVWGAGAAFATLLAGSVAGYLALNFVADQRLVSWLAAVAVPVVAFAVTATRLAASSPERRRKSAVRIGLLALGGSILAVRLVTSMAPTFPQIGSVMSDADLPAGYQRIREERRGDRLCRDDCPRILRYYRVPPDAVDPVRDIVLALYRHGWSPEDPLAPRGTSPAALKDGIRAHVLAIENGQVQIYLDAG